VQPSGELNNLQDERMHMKWTTTLIFSTLTIWAFAQQVRRADIRELEKQIAGSDSILVINFWATWCKPCLEELPYFHDIARTYRDRQLKLLLVSLDFKKDYPEQIRSFAKKNGYDSEIIWLDETDADQFCPVIDPTWSGAIPATLIINRRTGYRKFHEGKMKPDELESAIRASLR
jgi:thiol-disulfide isomerase/thioredoxin